MITLLRARKWKALRYLWLICFLLLPFIDSLSIVCTTRGSLDHHLLNDLRYFWKKLSDWIYFSPNTGIVSLSSNDKYESRLEKGQSAFPLLRYLLLDHFKNGNSFRMATTALTVCRISIVDKKRPCSVIQIRGKVVVPLSPNCSRKWPRTSSRVFYFRFLIKLLPSSATVSNFTFLSVNGQL